MGSWIHGHPLPEPGAIRGFRRGGIRPGNKARDKGGPGAVKSSFQGREIYTNLGKDKNMIIDDRCSYI